MNPQPNVIRAAGLLQNLNDSEIEEDNSTQGMLSSDEDISYQNNEDPEDLFSQDDDEFIAKQIAEMHRNESSRNENYQSNFASKNPNFASTSSPIKNNTNTINDNFSHATDFSHITSYMDDQSIYGFEGKKLLMTDRLKLKCILSENSEIMCVKIQQHRLFIGLASGIIKTYIPNKQNPSGLSCNYIFEDADTYKNTVTSITFCYLNKSEEPLLVASYVNGMIKFWHVSGQQCLSTIAESNSEALVCMISNNNRFLYTAGDRKVQSSASKAEDDIDKQPSYTINKYDVETRKLISTFGKTENNDLMDGHVRRIYSLKSTPVLNNIFISAGWDDTIQFWDDRIGNHSIRKITGPHVCSDDGLDICSDGSEILAASWRRVDNLQSFDFASGKIIKNYQLTGNYNPYNSYSCKYLESDSNLSSQATSQVALGTSTSNNLVIFDKNSIETPKGEMPSEMVTDLPGGVFGFDSTMLSNIPGTRKSDQGTRLFAVGSGENVYLFHQKTNLIQRGVNDE